MLASWPETLLVFPVLARSGLVSADEPWKCRAACPSSCVLGGPGSCVPEYEKSFRDAIEPPIELSGDAAVQRTPGVVGYVRTPPVGVAIIEKY